MARSSNKRRNLYLIGEKTNLESALCIVVSLFGVLTGG